MWHYVPWWAQPPAILVAGLVAIGAAYELSDCSPKVAALASVPVSLWWYIFLQARLALLRRAITSKAKAQVVNSVMDAGQWSAHSGSSVSVVSAVLKTPVESR